MATLAAMKLERLRYLRDLQQRASQVKHDVARYYDDPLGFAADCIDWRADGGLTAYQQEIIGGLPEKKRLAVRGPHGLGKSLMRGYHAAVVRADLRRRRGGLEGHHHGRVLEAADCVLVA